MTAWNKDKRVGQKKAFKLEEIWRIRIRLEIENKLEQLALFNLAIDSKLRSCDLISLKVRDISSASLIQSRAMIEQQKTHKKVQFEITPKTQQCLSQWVYFKRLTSSDFLFPRPRKLDQHICYHYYANIVKKWVSTLGLDITQYGTHSLRRTKASLIYSKTKSLRAIQLLLGHSKLQSTIKYLGVEIEDALSISESTET
jgi:integrase